jgi:hypothetical protein
LTNVLAEAISNAAEEFFFPEISFIAFQQQVKILMVHKERRE